MFEFLMIVAVFGGVLFLVKMLFFTKDTVKQAKKSREDKRVPIVNSFADAEPFNGYDNLGSFVETDFFNTSVTENIDPIKEVSGASLSNLD